jgi:hypothetical protein
LALFTVTFGFPNSKKNSFRGNYMRKYVIPSTLKTNYLLWHTQLIVCAVKYQIMV